MFTGIVRHVGLVKNVSRSFGGRSFTIDLGPLAQGLSQGDSVAVMGACLTASSISAPTAKFDVIAETLSKTTLGSLQKGSNVNLERSLQLSDALDGHLVQGHVDGVAEVRTIRTGSEYVIELTADPGLTLQMVSQGSICINGVSLTLVDVSERSFSVALIPTTLGDTTLGELKSGSKVNIETDIIGKYVQKYLGTLSRGSNSSGVTLDSLRQAGFLG